MSLLEQLAKEVFKEGKPLADIIESLVEAQYTSAMYKTKAALRAGVPLQDVVNSLVHGDGLPAKTATSLVLEAQSQVATEAANEARFKKATDEAIALYRNGVRQADVVSALKGFAPDIAEKVAKDNQHFYRA